MSDSDDHCDLLPAYRDPLQKGVLWCHLIWKECTQGCPEEIHGHACIPTYQIWARHSWCAVRHVSSLLFISARLRHALVHLSSEAIIWRSGKNQGNVRRHLLWPRAEQYSRSHGNLWRWIKLWRQSWNSIPKQRNDFWFAKRWLWKIGTDIDHGWTNLIQK